MIEAEAFRTFITVQPLFKSDTLRANIKLAFHKAFIRYVMIKVCLACEFTVHTRLCKLQRLQNKVLRTVGNFPSLTPVHELKKVLKNTLHILLQNKIMRAGSRSHTKS
jgi:hypothetical protein